MTDCLSEKLKISKSLFPQCGSGESELKVEIIFEGFAWRLVGDQVMRVVSKTKMKSGII